MKGLLSELLLKWRFDSKSSLLASPAVVDVDGDGVEEVLFGTYDGRIICLDASSVVKWTFAVRESVSLKESLFFDQELMYCIHASPTVVDVDGDGRFEVIFGTEAGMLYVLDNTGRLKWKFSAGSAIRGSVLAHDLLKDGKKVLVFGALDGFLYVLDSKGRLLWRFNAGAPIESSPTVLDEESVTFFFGTDDGSVCAVSEEGKLMWRFKTQDKVLAQPVVGELYKGSKCIVVGSMDYSLYVLSLKGVLYWSFKTEGSIVSRATLADVDEDGSMEIIFGSCDNNVYALTAQGDKLWSFEADFWIASPPMVADVNKDGHLEVVVGSYDHKVYILDGRGSYSLDFVPGLSGVVNQAGGYTELLTRESGQVVGKKLHEVKMDGMVVGCNWSSVENNLVVNTKTGKVDEVGWKR
ncbi:MAG: PQQ-binding-like beta-propeller repeat protein [Nanoarchaeota archaeon]